MVHMCRFIETTQETDVLSNSMHPSIIDYSYLCRPSIFPISFNFKVRSFHLHACNK